MLGTDNLKKIHLVGVGGAGMSGIAEILINMDYEVSGSDIHSSQITDRLQSLGLIFFNFHDKKNLKNVDLVVFSSAIDSNNPELIEANKRRYGPVFSIDDKLSTNYEDAFFDLSNTFATCPLSNKFLPGILLNNIDPYAYNANIY